ncbi:MAG: hydrogen peroxide-inducible genes activator [Hyphomicrobiales bacterium]|nr:hydrogen peroxide-inducible genes activator [Hyphomicrobiales bacterium]
MVTLRQLRYLAALAEHRHFGRAADACAVTQPALSMQVRELERLLDAPLVERRPGEVILTAVGRDVVARGRDILAAARDLMDAARHVNQVLSGGLSLGVIPTIAPYVLPLILPKLQQRHPKLRIELRETQTRILLDELARGALDVVLLALPVAHDDIETLELFHDPFVLAVPADHPQARTSEIDASDIDRERLILLEEGHCLRDQALALCAHAGSGAIGLGATSLATVMQLVANGYGITLLPQVAVAVEARDERVRLVHLTPPAPGRTVGLAWRRTSPRKADFAALGQLIRDTLGVAAAPCAQVQAQVQAEVEAEVEAQIQHRAKGRRGETSFS